MKTRFNKSNLLLISAYFLMLSTVTFALLEVISYYSLSDAEKNVSVIDLLSLQQNEFVEGRGQRMGCSFSETTIGHSMLGFVHRKKKYLSKSCNENYHINNIGLHTARDLPLFKNDEDFVILILGGSVADQFANYNYQSKSSKLEYLLNQSYRTPVKKKFKVYNGAAGAWSMPNQLNMLLMYGERVDAIVAIDGYNETFPIQARKRLEQIPAAQYILATSSSSSFRFTYMNMLWLYRTIVAKTWLKYSYTFNVGYKILLGILQKIIISPSLVEEFTLGNSEIIDLPPEEGEVWVAQSLERYMKQLHEVGKLSKVLTAEFLQPTRLYGKELTAKESRPKEYIMPSAFFKISQIYKRLEKNGYPVRDLTNIFKNEKNDIYSDHIHYLSEGNGFSPGNEILASNLVLNLEKLWNLKKKSNEQETFD